MYDWRTPYPLPILYFTTVTFPLVPQEAKLCATEGLGEACPSHRERRVDVCLRLRLRLCLCLSLSLF